MTKVDELMTTYRQLDEESQHEAHRLVHVTENLVAPLPAGPTFVDALPSVLVRSSVMGTEAEQRAAQGLRGIFGGTPPNVAALESASSALAKWWAATFGGAGVLVGLGTWWTGAAGRFWSSAGEPVRVATVVAAAVTLASLLVSIAIIVNADLRARSEAGAAQYAARAVIAGTYMDTVRFRNSQTLPCQTLKAAIGAAGAAGRTICVQQSGETLTADDCRLHNGAVELHTGGAWVRLLEDATVSLV